ncbi:MAG: phosphoribosylformylglycinamidine synthase subunit PurS [Fimbriimonadaceae bacterium]|nr:phosphoribosylformylglycinamidine synthase subunit PurS [Fimbriimonadaceae bacterium]
MPTVRVSVRLKPSLLDSAGRTVNDSLHGLGFAEVDGVRIGRLVEFQMDPVDEGRIRSMCERLIANPVIEDYEFEVVD